MQKKPSLPALLQLTYALGQLGWSTLVNVIGIQLIYFYIPPENAGIAYFITQATFWGIFNAVSLIAASGRLWDAVTDPLIAHFSDHSRHRKGRRIPFLLYGSLPAALFCALMFFPPVPQVSFWNLLWLLVTQTLFYLFLTVYVTPYFALLAELGHSARERLNLSTWISITYALGIIVAAQAPALAGRLQEVLNLSPAGGFQAAVVVLAVVAFVFMLLPPLTIEEGKYCEVVPSEVPMLEAVKRTFRNRNFLFYVIADFAYFAALSIIMTGLLYYTTVLLFPENQTKGKELIGVLLALMVVVSFLFYPVVNLLARRLGKKVLVVFALIFYGFDFAGVWFLGKSPLNDFLSREMQAYLLIILASIPISFLGILPNAILADIAEHDALKSGVRQEGMYFAARTFMQKMGQTFGILVFAMLTILGKDPGNDLGIRLSGVVGFLLSVGAGFVFTLYREKELLEETAKLEKAHYA
ncbi:MAG: MFS transporter [Leptospiraceae bacterium]|nr:MFS transporter [Leptospiraceae bacterium]MDW8306666.1 MFS transporter [Leptospiraceae bacterium]